MESMKKVGITGSIGAGKSFVGSLLRDRGFRVLDADIAVHALYRENATLRGELAENFGEECLTPSGVNRDYFIRKIFSDDGARMRLESIVYPHLTRYVKEFLEEPARENPHCVLFVEAALLSRAPGIVGMLDEIWIVDAPEDMRLERLVNRGMERSDALRRIENQRGECIAERFAGKTVHTLENAGLRGALESRLDALLR
jgi:dephospho-CoA kinase